MKLDEKWLNERAGELTNSILFLTRLRYGSFKPAGGAVLARAGWAFPIAGILVGIIGSLVYFIAQRIGLPPWPASALAVAATMAATGCLHEDGLADTADGFGGGTTRERKLDIMRDSRIGTYGVCVLALSILLRVSALAGLAQPSLVFVAMVAAHGAARAILPAFMFLVPQARVDGLSFAAGIPPQGSVVVAAVLGVLILALCFGPLPGLVCLIALLLGAACIGWLALAQIDGQTGDVLGAVEQVGEIIILLAALG